MSRLVPILCAVATVGIGLTAWSQLSAGDTDLEIPKGATPAAPPAGQDAGAALRKARQQCSLAAIDAVVAKVRGDAEARPEDAATWRLLAEAHLERAQQRTHLRGIAVGEPVFDKLPAALEADLEAGMAAVARAREHGDDTGQLFRIEAGLMSQRITGWTSALQWNGKIGRALKEAGERDADDPKLHVALGLRKLLAPKLFGHDPEKALEYFEFAAAQDDDERPAVFAGMASYLQKKRQQAIGWLEQAVAKNPSNRFARVVLERLRRGEEDPFGRDVTEAEFAALGGK